MAQALLDTTGTAEIMLWKDFTAAAREAQLATLPDKITTFRKGTKWLRPELVGQRVVLWDEGKELAFATAKVLSVKAVGFGDIDQVDHDRQSGDMTPEARLEIMRKVYGDYDLNTLTTVVTLGEISVL